jgi:hypothetical protein
MKIVVLMLALALPAAQALAERPEIGVDFRLEEPDYRQRFDAADIARLEALCEARLAAALSEELAFANFVPLEGQADRLIIRLGSSGGSGMHPTYFHLDVEGPGVRAEADPVSWEFRSLIQYLDLIEDVPSFAEEIQARFEGHLAEQRDQLVENLFSSLALTHDAFLILDEAAWVLPFSRSELQANEDSEFLIRAQLLINQSRERPGIEVRSVGETLEDSTGVPPQYRRKIKTRIKDEDRATLERLRQAEEVQVLHVFLTRFVRFRPPPVERTTPTELDIGGAP